MEKPGEYAIFTLRISDTPQPSTNYRLSAPLAGSTGMHTSDACTYRDRVSSTEATQPVDSMYELTSDISNARPAYDQALSDITRSLYQPLPDT